jgi:polar amino acid transport system permease protein
MTALATEDFSRLLEGFGVTLKLTAVVIAVSFPLGLLFALGVRSKATPLRGASLFVVEVGRGAPALIILLFFYFGLPHVGIVLPAFLAAVLALSLNAGAYISEIMRAGIEGVPHGQVEAAMAVGLNRRDVLRYVVVPQGVRIATPPLMGWTIVIFQETALCYAIALPELMSRAYEVGTEDFDYLGALLIASAMYAAVALPAAHLVRMVEGRMARGH